jgi:hypothetical protein
LSTTENAAPATEVDDLIAQYDAVEAAWSALCERYEDDEVPAKEYERHDDRLTDILHSLVRVVRKDPVS